MLNSFMPTFMVQLGRIAQQIPRRRQGTQMSLDPAAIRRIARLARLRVSDAEVDSLQHDLNTILGWIDQLNEVNVEGVEPLTGGTSIALRLREDVVTEPDLTEAVLSNAPDRDGPFYTVPKVVE